MGYALFKKKVRDKFRIFCIFVNYFHKSRYSNMEVTVKTQKDFRILKRNEEIHNPKELEAGLSAANRLVGGNFHIMDYARKQIIVNNSSWILCGYSKEIADAEGFDFFSRILNEDEQTWMTRVNQASYQVLFNYSKVERFHLLLSYDVTVRNINDTEFILNHKVTPLKLCENGNLWLGLCQVSLSSDRIKSHTATLTNTLSGEKYDFINGNFVLRDYDDTLTPLQELIIMYLIQGRSDAEICDELGISMDQLKRIKQKLYTKFNVKKTSAVVHKAHQERTLPSLLKGEKN